MTRNSKAEFFKKKFVVTNILNLSHYSSTKTHKRRFRNFNLSSDIASTMLTDRKISLLPTPST